MGKVVPSYLKLSETTVSYRTFEDKHRIGAHLSAAAWTSRFRPDDRNRRTPHGLTDGCDPQVVANEAMKN